MSSLAARRDCLFHSASRSSTPSGVASGPTLRLLVERIAQLKALHVATNFRANSSAIGSATMKRLAAMQDCAIVLHARFDRGSHGLSKSALGITMKGSLPPVPAPAFLILRPALPL